MELNLTRKFFLALLAVLTTVIAALMAMQNMDRRADLEETIQAKGQDTAALLAAASIQPILNYDTDSLQRLVEQVLADPAVIAAEVGNSDGGVSASAETEARGQKRRFTVAVIGEENVEIGQVAIGLDTAHYEGRLAAGIRNNVLMLGVTGLSLMGFITLLLHRIVIRPLNTAVDRLAELAAGDLRGKVSTQRRDELGRLLEAVRRTGATLRQHTTQINESTEELASAAAQIHDVANESSQAAARQHQETDEIARAINELSGTVNEIARNAADAASASQRAANESENGRAVVSMTVSSINELAAELGSTAGTIAELENNTAEIGGVLDVINGIAEQTNLLALNAAIEAARAGEQGRGFAVVAEEVRTLAQRTESSTQEIKSMIERLQNGARNAVAAVDAGNERAKTTVVAAADAGNALEAIAAQVVSMADMMTLIAGAAEQQGAVSSDISRNVENISLAAQATASGAGRTAAAVDTLQRHVDTLKQLSHTFRL